MAEQSSIKEVLTTVQESLPCDTSSLPCTSCTKSTNDVDADQKSSETQLEVDGTISMSVSADSVLQDLIQKVTLVSEKYGLDNENIIEDSSEAALDVNEVQQEEKCLVSLVDLPTEVFLQICSYLSARILMQTMRLVCKRLNEILSDDFIWKSRILKRCSRQVYPPLQVGEESINWKAACIMVEEQQERWSNMQRTMKHLMWRDVHLGSIDAIMLTNKGALCVSGSQDRCLAVFNVNSSDPNPLTHIEAHKGWIWGLSAKSDACFYTCSWDFSVKLWTLDEGKLTASDTFTSSSPLLSVASSPNIVAMGSYDKRVWLWDPRSGPHPAQSYIAHRRAVLKVCMLGDNAVLSISEDKTLAVWDLRASKILKDKIVVIPQEPKVNAFPMCMSLNSNMLYVGDSKNKLHLIDPRRDSPTSFQVVGSYNAGHKDLTKITGVQHGLGCVITGSSDGTVRVSTPTHCPELITSFQTIGTAVAALDFQHGILAVGCTNCAVELWVPEAGPE